MKRHPFACTSDALGAIDSFTLSEHHVPVTSLLAAFSGARAANSARTAHGAVPVPMPVPYHNAAPLEHVRMFRTVEPSSSHQATAAEPEILQVSPALIIFHFVSHFLIIRGAPLEVMDEALNLEES